MQIQSSGRTRANLCQLSCYLFHLYTNPLLNLSSMQASHDHVTHALATTLYCYSSLESLPSMIPACHDLYLLQSKVGVDSRSAVACPNIWWFKHPMGQATQLYTLVMSYISVIIQRRCQLLHMQKYDLHRHIGVRARACKGTCNTLL